MRPIFQHIITLAFIVCLVSMGFYGGMVLEQARTADCTGPEARLINLCRRGVTQACDYVPITEWKGDT